MTLQGNPVSHDLVSPGRAALLILDELVLPGELTDGAGVAAGVHHAVVTDAAPDLVLVPHLGAESDHGARDAAWEARVLPHVTGQDVLIFSLFKQLGEFRI